jgi:type I restriction enzyme, S subunit
MTFSPDDYQHYPLDLYSLPASWTVTDIASVATTVQPGFPSGKHNADGQGIPHLRPMNISREGTIDLSEIKYVADDPGARLVEGDVLFNNTNSPALVGKTAVVRHPQNWAFSNHMTRITPASGVSPTYLAHHLHYLWMSGYFRHRCVNHVNQASISSGPLSSSVPIALPPTAEQERIVAAIEEEFSRLDAGVAALERVRQNLKRLRESLVSGLAETASEWTTLGAIADIAGGVTKDQKKQDDPTYVEVPYLRVANVQRGYLDLAEVTNIRVPIKKAEQLYLQPGDILFNEGGDRDKLGRGWVWQGEIPNCIHQNHVFRARVNQDEFEPKFVSIHGNTFGRQWFEEMGRQTTNLASLNMTTLKRFPVPVLPLQEQRALVAAIDDQNSIIAAIDEALDHSTRRVERLRSSVLAAAFSGEFVPQDPNDEPASVLLERIAADRASFNGHKSTRTRKPRTTRKKVAV